MIDLIYLFFRSLLISAGIMGACIAFVLGVPLLILEFEQASDPWVCPPKRPVSWQGLLQIYITTVVVFAVLDVAWRLLSCTTTT